MSFSSERLMNVLLSPVISEKSTYVGDKRNQIVFRVADDATKAEIKAAVELMWKEKKVEVAGVQVLNIKGKPKRFQQRTGRRRNWRKAYVQLKPGHEINFAVGEQ